MSVNIKLIKDRLTAVLAEIRVQNDVGRLFPPEVQGFSEQVGQISEWIEDADEYGIAYESLVSMLEEFPFQISGRVAIKLLEVGLLMRFKTERVEDAAFDSREVDT
jgi:hypothetical protein